MRCADRQAGLTLIELLVGFVLLGLLLGLLQDGFMLGHRVWERATTGPASRIEAVEGAQSFLRERLVTLYPTWRPVGQAATSVAGTANLIGFEAAPPGLLGGGTYRRFLLTRSAEGALEVAWRPDTERAPMAPFQRAVLLPDIAALEIAYFGPREGGPPAWHSAWSGEERPPRLVRIRVAFPPADPRIWPDLVVAPRAVVDANCAFDPNNRRCRGRS